MLQVKCPRCGKEQNYNPGAGMMTEKSKRCVYCGHAFKVHSNQSKSRIVKIVKP